MMWLIKVLLVVATTFLVAGPAVRGERAAQRFWGGTTRSLELGRRGDRW
ncbi:MAG: hypothetical protein OWU33_12765 [Firmicutes bacterium]|nr:hypothetical protein [Bacillota bacterium]